MGLPHEKEKLLSRRGSFAVVDHPKIGSNPVRRDRKTARGHSWVCTKEEFIQRLTRLEKIHEAEVLLGSGGGDT